MQLQLRLALHSVRRLIRCVCDAIYSSANLIRCFCDAIYSSWNLSHLDWSHFFGNRIHFFSGVSSHPVENASRFWRYPICSAGRLVWGGLDMLDSGNEIDWHAPCLNAFYPQSPIHFLEDFRASAFLSLQLGALILDHAILRTRIMSIIWRADFIASELPVLFILTQKHCH